MRVLGLSHPNDPGVRIPGRKFRHRLFRRLLIDALTGENAHGDYVDHVLSWYEHRSDQNVLFVHYEGVKQDPAVYVLEVAGCIGEKFPKTLMEDGGVLRNVLRYSDFEAMKEHNRASHVFSRSIEDRNPPLSLKKALTKDGCFSYVNIRTREGIVGDWKVHFMQEMNASMEVEIWEKLSRIDLIHVWKKHPVM